MNDSVIKNLEQILEEKSKKIRSGIYDDQDMNDYKTLLETYNELSKTTLNEMKQNQEFEISNNEFELSKSKVKPELLIAIGTGAASIILGILNIGSKWFWMDKAFKFENEGTYKVKSAEGLRKDMLKF